MNCNINNLYDNWHHITVTAENKGKKRIYVDGKLCAENKAGDRGLSNNKDLNLGVKTVNGSIDEFKIWNKILTSLEVKEDFESVFKCDEDGDVGNDYYRKGIIISNADVSGYVGYYEKKDICVDNNKLSEYFCNNNYGDIVEFNCPNGCKDGACVRATNQTNQKVLYLKDIKGNLIKNPALVIIEEKDDKNKYHALITLLESGYSLNDGIGVDSSLSGDTWSSGSSLWTASRASNSKITDAADKFGSIVTFDANDGDRVKANISYPDEQVYALIYITGYNESAPLFTGGTKLYVNDSLNKVRYTLAKIDLPKLLKSESFSGNVDANISFTISIGSNPRVIFAKQPTSSDDPNYVLTTSTNRANYIYNWTILFDKAINFKHSDSIGKKIKLFGKEYEVSNETNNIKLVLVNSEDKITLEDGSSVMIGVFDKTIDGTFVKFTGGVEAMTKLTISVFAPDSEHDAIRQGESFIDPVFKILKLDFTGLNIPVGSLQRETIPIFNFGDDKMRVNFTEHRRYLKDIMFAKGFSDGRVELMVDADNRNMTVAEMQKITWSDYVVVGNEDDGRLVKLTAVKNSSSIGSSNTDNDKVELTDVFSGDIYRTVWTSDGVGSIIIGGLTYGVYLTGNANNATEEYQVQLDYPDSSGVNTGIIYPTIQTSLGAKVMFYEPLKIDLKNWDGRGNSLNVIRIPDGDGYTDVSTNSSEVKVGELTFVLSSS